ncbi:hypothetical protein [Pseudomonas chlororaphis]|uniref:hypothetical protein n=1 Tax=Pseudomonas chlororaphis TaxID=587753 RepID=UPI00164BB12A|nr:hypothetical protein [Pseudomonas chlororaphis]
MQAIAKLIFMTYVSEGVKGGAILQAAAANKKSAFVICMIDGNDDCAPRRAAPRRGGRGPGASGYLREADYASGNLAAMRGFQGISNPQSDHISPRARVR